MVGQFAVKHYKNDTWNYNLSKTCLGTLLRIVMKRAITNISASIPNRALELPHDKMKSRRAESTETTLSRNFPRDFLYYSIVSFFSNGSETFSNGLTSIYRRLIVLERNLLPKV